MVPDSLAEWAIHPCIGREAVADEDRRRMRTGREVVVLHHHRLILKRNGNRAMIGVRLEVAMLTPAIGRMSECVNDRAGRCADPSHEGGRHRDVPPDCRWCERSLALSIGVVGALVKYREI
ncbi:hypothetical protein IT414_02145 [bacterium]|nr:hypothetical protein [bacterium]